MQFPKSAKKKSQSKTWRRKCLALWSQIVRLRAGGMCERCSRLAKDAHHVIPRGTSPKPGWFDLNNGVSLCFICHRVHGAHSLDVDEQLEFRDWVKGYLARKNVDYDVLKIRCKAPGKIPEADYVFLYEELKKEKAKYS